MHFSVIIPIYNTVKYLDRCLSSLSQQKSNSSYEVIMVDDGSTDGSSFIAKKYAYENKQFKYFYQNNQGSNVAYNKGLIVSKGDYVLFLDSDDYFVGNIFTELEKVINKGMPDIVEFSPMFKNGATKTFDKINENTVYFKNELINYIKNGTINSISVAFKAIKRTVLDQIGQPYFDKNPVGADTIFITKVLTLAKSVAFSKTIFYCIEERNDSQCRKSKNDKELFSIYSNLIFQLIDNFSFFTKQSLGTFLPLWQYGRFYIYSKKMFAIVANNPDYLCIEKKRKLQAFLIKNSKYIINWEDYNFFSKIKYYLFCRFPIISMRIYLFRNKRQFNVTNV